jgi:hypothetical protein
MCEDAHSASAPQKQQTIPQSEVRVANPKIK